MAPAGRPRSPDRRNLPPGVYARVRKGRTRYYDAAGHALGNNLRQAALLVAQRAAGPQFTAGTWTAASSAFRRLLSDPPSSRPLSAHTRKNYGKHLDALERAIGAARLDDLRPLHVRQILAATEDRPYWSAALLKTWRVVWSRAIEIGLTERRDPSEGIRAPRTPARRVHVTDAMLMAVAAHGDQILRDWCRLSVVCGQRVSDVLLLTRQHIVGDELRPPNTKTGEPIRIAIVDDLRTVLDELLTRPRPVSGPYLIQTERGRPVTYTMLAKRFDAAAAAARAADPTLPHFQRRDLRAKSATDEPGTAQARLGHTSATMTARHYLRDVPLAQPGRLPDQNSLAKSHKR